MTDFSIYINNYNVYNVIACKYSEARQLQNINYLIQHSTLIYTTSAAAALFA